MKSSFIRLQFLPKKVKGVPVLPEVERHAERMRLLLLTYSSIIRPRYVRLLVIGSLSRSSTRWMDVDVILVRVKISRQSGTPLYARFINRRNDSSCHVRITAGDLRPTV
jgi:hypothetical protein